MTRDSLRRFAELVSREQFDLAEASLLIAQDEYPELDVPRYIARIDAMADTIRGRLAADAFGEQRVVALNHYLFGELGYAGDIQTYYDRRNSYLNDVIERRTGIPITLSVLYMEIGRRIGLALQGVSFPGHFLVKLKVKRGQLVLDPFTGGEPQGEDDLKKRLEQVLPPRDAPIEIDRYIQAASARQIVVRMLRNLKGIHTKAGDNERSLAVTMAVKLYDLHQGATLGFVPGWRRFVVSLPNLSSIVLRKVHHEPIPERSPDLVRMLRYLLQFALGLLMAVAVSAHSSSTDSVAFSWKSATIRSSLPFCPGSSLHLVFRILRMASCRMSPISSTVCPRTCASRYSMAFLGLLLLRRMKALRLVDRSVSLRRSSSISSSISPMMSDPKCM